MPAEEPLTRASFRKLSRISTPEPMPRLPTRRWTDAEWARLRLGHKARRMKGKWQVFAEDETVYVHRSWTGHGVFEACLEEDPEGGWRIASAVVESDPERYRSRGPEFASVTLELVLSSVVLGEPAEELWARYAELLES
ncbi:hypothetical protein [Streptomyces oceani]|uniref:Uncharacterized protein n=1 Tax=Streptomyces oceani TaxID=1075402 RepID=A0A1E7KME4_9ACTN|nr:hypothetical protein [Streptomyces oceani]OEV05083.1 hypothetical protein AN216_04495 [Streptomyces oceani]